LRSLSKDKTQKIFLSPTKYLTIDYIIGVSNIQG